MNSHTYKRDNFIAWNCSFHVVSYEIYKNNSLICKVFTNLHVPFLPKFNIEKKIAKIYYILNQTIKRTSAVNKMNYLQFTITSMDFLAASRCYKLYRSHTDSHYIYTSIKIVQNFSRWYGAPANINMDDRKL